MWWVQVYLLIAGAFPIFQFTDLFSRRSFDAAMSCGCQQSLGMFPLSHAFIQLSGVYSSFHTVTMQEGQGPHFVPSLETLVERCGCNLQKNRPLAPADFWNRSSFSDERRGGGRKPHLPEITAEAASLLLPCLTYCHPVWVSGEPQFVLWEFPGGRWVPPFSSRLSR